MGRCRQEGGLLFHDSLSKSSAVTVKTSLQILNRVLSWVSQLVEMLFRGSELQPPPGSSHNSE